MFESAEVNYRETQYGVRVEGEIKPVAIGPAEAERYRASGVDIHQRERTVYYPDTTEWREVPAPTEARVTRGEGS